ncbi:hypothetical protein MD484_g7483, partial [Candolleomyces efflorescens]
MDGSGYSLLFSALKVAQNERYSIAAALTFLGCDMISTIHDELAGLSNCVSCKTYIRVLSLLGSKLCTFITDLICIVRIYALYGRNKKVLGILSFFCAFDLALGTYAVYEITNFRKSPSPPRLQIPGEYGCFGMFEPSVSGLHRRLYYVAWILSTGNAVIFFLFTVFRLVRSLTDQEGSISYRSLKNRQFVSPLLVAFVRDGASVFLGLVVILSISLFCAIYRDSFYYGLAWPWLYAVFSWAVR